MSGMLKRSADRRQALRFLYLRLDDGFLVGASLFDGERGFILLLASQQGGGSATSTVIAKRPTQPRWFAILPVGKPPRPRRMLRGTLLMARPPLLANDARMGIFLSLEIS